jgi:hypothetical protein
VALATLLDERSSKYFICGLSPFCQLRCVTILFLQDFEARKRLLRERTNKKHAVPKQLASIGRDHSEFPFLQVCLHTVLKLAMIAVFLFSSSE